MTLTEIVEAMSKVHAVIIGDAIQDEYIFGRVDRLCPEAPVPCFIPEREETRPGGAMNVVEQMRALGGVGKGVCGVPTSVKRRFMVGHQMLLRVDSDAVSATSFPAFVEGLSKHVFGEGRLDVIILSDYAKGALSEKLCQYVINFANENGITVVVDPKHDWEKFKGCDWICPNQSEFHSGMTDDWIKANILMKRGADGLRVRTDGSGYVDIPAAARHVFDVTGAGDTVTAVFAAGLAAGANPVQAATIANIAAGWVVGEVGTTVCPKEKLLELVK